MANINSTAYRIRFVTQNENIVLPINPNEVSVQYPADNVNYNVVGIGEIIVPRTPKLATVSFESFFPKTGAFAPYVNENAWYEPKDYVNFFRKLQTDREIFKLIICRADGYDPTFDTNIEAILNDFSITDKGGECGDVYYSMSISEWRSAKPEKLETASKGKKADGVTVESKKMVALKQRKTSTYPLKVGQIVSVTGRIYQTENQTTTMWKKYGKTASNVTASIGRISKNKKRVYVFSLGWIDENDCKPIDESTNTVIMKRG